MEVAFNAAAHREGWPMHMSSGHITVSARCGTWQTDMLTMAVDYTVNVGGMIASTLS
jgi:hypothetical protein